MACKSLATAAPFGHCAALRKLCRSPVDQPQMALCRASLRFYRLYRPLRARCKSGQPASTLLPDQHAAAVVGAVGQRQ